MNPESKNQKVDCHSPKGLRNDNTDKMDCHADKSARNDDLFAGFFSRALHSFRMTMWIDDMVSKLATSPKQP
ncbi:hypothetical protein [Helicobacter fennelliae]|uniref:hypothetical protein n=1 Tax=Helicobacter fennelliae TaxID=215 RepID=UPI0011DE4AD0|nr:hypothetical protein [Helicobacter fennelliae]